MLGCCADLRYERRLNVSEMCYDVEVACTTSGSAAVLGVGAAVPGGVASGHWGGSDLWAGPGRASAVGSESSQELAGADRAGTGVVGARMAGPGRLGFNPHAG